MASRAGTSSAPRSVRLYSADGGEVGGSWAESQLDLMAEHPELGPVSLRQLLATWVTHDLDHVVQVSRVMAKRYAAAVGPWKAYLRVVRD